MILPDEIVNKEFTRVKRGYDIDEVEDYIALLLEKYDTLCRENMELEKNLKSVLTVLEGKKKSESAANEIIEAAKKESERIIAEAMSKAEKIRVATVAGQAVTDERELAEIREKIARCRREYARLREEIDSFKLKLFDMYSKHITLVEQIPLPDVEEDGEAAEETVKKNEGYERVRSQLRVAEPAEKDTPPADADIEPDMPTIEMVIPAADRPIEEEDAESGARFGLNIVREPIRPAAEEAEEKPAMSQTDELFPLKFVTYDEPKKRKK